MKTSHYVALLVVGLTTLLGTVGHAQNSTSTLLNIQRDQDEVRRQRTMNDIRRNSESFARQFPPARQSGSTGSSGGAAISGSGRSTNYSSSGYTGGPSVDSGPASIESTTTINTSRAPLSEGEIVGLIRIAAVAGEPVAQWRYGQMLYAGFGPLQRDPVAAHEWLTKAAQGGQSAAMGQLAWMSKFGVGTKVDASTALRWMKAGSEKGDGYSTFLLSSAYLSGDGIPQNMDEAMRLTELAAEQGDPRAQWFLGQAYLDGDLRSKNISKALTWLSKSADQDEPAAQSTLGAMHLSGQHPVPQPTEGVRLTRLAAEGGITRAMVNMGFVYLQGKTVPVDAAAGAAWMLRAAEKGSADGQHLYGLLLSVGEGVTMNRSEAVRWLSKAADAGHPRAAAKLKELGER